jgi:hypothetical protein
MDGRLERAERLRQSAASIGAAANSDNALLLVASQRAMLQCELRASAGQVAFFHEVLDRFPDYAVMARPAIAYAHATAGDVQRARDVAATFDPTAYTVDALGSEFLTTVMMAVHVIWLADTRQHTASLYDMLLPHRSLFAVDGIAGYLVGSVERSLGVLAALAGDTDLARGHFTAALHAHRRVRSPLLVAGTLRDAGACLDDRDMTTEAAAAFAALGAAGALRPSEPVGIDEPAGPAFRRDGDGWQLEWGGHGAHLRHTKGMADLAHLLASPHSEIHVLDLVDPGPNLIEGSTGDDLDATARRQYRVRLEELERELADADRAGDVARSELIHREREALVTELSTAYGLGGRARRRGDSSERARSAVTQRIRDAIARIEGVEPDLARHLRRSIRTGTFCAYEPETPLEWRL